MFEKERSVSFRSVLLFVDLRGSTQLFSKEAVNVAKAIRGFTPEIIEISKKDTDDNLMEIGIRKELYQLLKP